MTRRKFTFAQSFSSIARYLLGSLYLFGALIHITLLTNSPAFYSGFENTALIQPYRTFFAETFPQQPAVYIIPIALFELAIGALILFGRGNAVKLGLLGGIVFNIAIAPLGWWGVLNILLVLLQGYMLNGSYRHSVVDTKDPNPLLP